MVLRLSWLPECLGRSLAEFFLFYLGALGRTAAFWRVVLSLFLSGRFGRVTSEA